MIAEQPSQARGAWLCAKKRGKKPAPLRNIVSGPEIGVPGFISVGF
jgi:hypothetical protein